jgi:hypothetical protein
MSQMTGTGGRPGDRRPGDGRFGAATPGLRAGRTGIGDLVTAPAGGRRRKIVTPWRVTALVSAVLVAGGSYALGRYVIAPKPPPAVEIAVTAVALPAGARLTAADVRVVTVQAAAVPKGYLSPAAAAGVLGEAARQALPAGAFLARSMLSPSGGLPGPSQALVGLDLKAGQLPAGGLAVGQRVLIVLLPVNAQGNPLTPVALISTTVWDISAADAAGDVEASVIVPSSMATGLAGYAARGQVSLVATAAAPAPRTTPSSSPAPHASHKPAKRTSHH